VFALRVEELIQADVDTYLTKVTADDAETRKQHDSEASDGDRQRRKEATPAE
jgi:hypothetical protein